MGNMVVGSLHEFFWTDIGDDGKLSIGNTIDMDVGDVGEECLEGELRVNRREVAVALLL